MANITSYTCNVLEGPSYHDIMNSFASSRLGDAFPVSFTLLLTNSETIYVVGKIVGIGWKDNASTLWDVKMQLNSRLSLFNPICPKHIDIQLNIYKPHVRKGSGKITLPAYKTLMVE